MKIAIIGGGWTGCHLALRLTKEGHSVTILERNTDIFQGVSGNFGIRLHKGPHYPRSEKTRIRCRDTFDRFSKTYPDLVVPHEYSIYALGGRDAMGNTPKVTTEEFRKVCFEDPSCKEIDLATSEYKELLMATDMEEPSVAIGGRLRETFRKYLKDAGVKLVYNFEVSRLVETATTDMTVIGIMNKRQTTTVYEKVINASGYNSTLLPSHIEANFPFTMETTYQPCIALVYTDMYPSSDKPFSFIVMDGWFPCIMPYIDETSDPEGVQTPAPRRYILTHGCYTIMASCANPTAAYDVLNSISDKLVEDDIRPRCEYEINRFWPNFSKRFKYESWKGEVLCKLKTEKEFRGCVTYAGPYGVIHVIPGKISNIFDAEEETMKLIRNDPEEILVKNRYKYVKGGVLDVSCNEIGELPNSNEMSRSTCFLNTFSDITKLSKPPVMNTSDDTMDANSNDSTVFNLQA